MLYAWLSVIIRMPAAFQNIIKSKDIALDISIRVRDRITHTGLGRQIHNNFRFPFLKNLFQETAVCDISLMKRKNYPNFPALSDDILLS